MREISRPGWGKLLAVAVVVALAAAPGAAGAQTNQRGMGGRHRIPEFDPAAAGAIAALVAGGGVLLARRRKRSR
jgi:LPXTG-motif cell wall-anchored protein